MTKKISAPPAAPEDSELLGFRMGRVMHALRQQVDEALRPQGFSMGLSVLLFILKRSPGLSNAELARILSVTPQAMGEKIAELEKSGYLARRHHAGGGRKLVAELTPAGLKKIASSRVVMANIESQMLSTFTPAERQRLEGLLDRCYHNISAEPPRKSG